MDNWDNIRYFLAVARAGTASRAAIELSVTHATVLRRIDQFEQQLGVKLFRRLQRGYRLTDAGAAMVEPAGRVEAAAQALGQQFKDHDQALAGSLRVCQPENHVIDLYPLYQAFSRRYPLVQLEIQASPDVVNLNHHETDIAIRIIEQPPESLIGRKLGTIDFSAYCSLQYQQVLSEPSNAEDYQWIIWQGSNTTPSGSAHRRWLKKHLPQAHIIMQASNIADLVEACRAGIGVALISRHTASRYDDLVEVPIPAATVSRTLWLLTHRDLRELPRVRCFMQFMGEAIRAKLEGSHHCNNKK